MQVAVDAEVEDATVVGRRSENDSLFDASIATFEDDAGAYDQKEWFESFRSERVD